MGNKLRRETTLGSADDDGAKPGALTFKAAIAALEWGRIFASRSARSRLACASANVRCFSASNRRTFSIAIAAWSAKDSRSAIWLSENGRTSHRRTAREGYMNAVVEPIHSKQRLRAQGWRLG